MNFFDKFSVGPRRILQGRLEAAFHCDFIGTNGGKSIVRKFQVCNVLSFSLELKYK